MKDRRLLTIFVLVSCLIPAVCRAATGAEEQIILGLENDFDQALLQGNADALNRITADGFACKVGDSGFVSKAALMEFMKANGSAWQSIADRDVHTSVYDGDTVIVRGVSVRKYKGTNDLLKLRFTRVYSKINSVWRLVAMHAEQIS